MFQQSLLYVVTILGLCWPYYYYPYTHADRLNQQYSQWRHHNIQPRPQPIDYWSPQRFNYHNHNRQYLMRNK